MKTTHAFIVLSLVVLLFSCRKDHGIGENEIIYSDYFNSNADLSGWTVSSSGMAEITDSTQTEGSASLHMKAVSGCLSIEKNQGVAVESNTNYELKFDAQAIFSQTGDIASCAGDYLIILSQRDDEIGYFDVYGITGWSTQYEYFTTVSSLPVKVKILIGTYHGAWIDNLTITKIK